MSEEMMVNLLVGGAALAVLLVGLLVWFVVVLRHLDRGWRTILERRRTLDAALKERGSLIPRLSEITRHRLTAERETLERLARLRSKSVGGRTPREKAGAEAELDAAFARIVRAADADPGLSGLTEFEETRRALDAASQAIEEAAQGYDAAVDAYNHRAAGFPGRYLAGLGGAPAAERFGKPPARPPASAAPGIEGAATRATHSA